MNRVILPYSIRNMEEILEKAGVSSQGVENMAPKAFSFPVRLTDVELGAANIIKQEMLTVGGDAAIARGVVEGIRKETDVILLGTVDKIRKLIRKLSHYTTFGIPEIRKDIQNLLNGYLSGYRYQLNCRHSAISLEKTRIMGVLNVTPDSFSDSGEHHDAENAVSRGLEMFEQGADIIDIGGESTRPGSEPVSEEIELSRVIPVIEGIRQQKDNGVISVDTYKASVARQSLIAGADMINDISALTFDKKMIDLLMEFPDVPVILMHIKGTPATMQHNPVYEDVVDEILSFFEERIDFCMNAGLTVERILIDPGIGFGKSFEHNLEIFRRLSEFHSLGVPVVIGASRKSFISKIYPSEPKERLNGSLGVTAEAFRHNISIVRVHDVKDHHELLETLGAINYRASSSD